MMDESIYGLVMRVSGFSWWIKVWEREGLEGFGSGTAFLGCGVEILF